MDCRYSAEPIQTANDGTVVVLYTEPEPLEKGVWHDWILHVRWSYDSDGFVEAWLDGEQVIDYAGPVGNTFAGITIMPDPDNPRPCHWHVRDYGFMCANPFGHKAFKLGDKARTPVEPDASLSLGFGILIHRAANEASVDLHTAYKDYLGLKDE